jgi:hypothetical protein
MKYFSISAHPGHTNARLSYFNVIGIGEDGRYSREYMLEAVPSKIKLAANTFITLINVM